MSKSLEELTVECFVAMAGKTNQAIAIADVKPLLAEITSGLVETAKRQQDYYKALKGELK